MARNPGEREYPSRSLDDHLRLKLGQSGINSLPGTSGCLSKLTSRRPSRFHFCPFDGRRNRQTEDRWPHQMPCITAAIGAAPEVRNAMETEGLGTEVLRQSVKRRVHPPPSQLVNAKGEFWFHMEPERPVEASSLSNRTQAAVPARSWFAVNRSARNRFANLAV